MAGVIRRESFCSTPAFSFEDLEARAHGILARAREQARRIEREAVARGREAAEQARAAGHAEGLRQGREEGLRQIRAEVRETVLQETRCRLEQLVQALSAGLAEFEGSKHRLLGEAEAGLIQIALAIGRRVCKVIVEASPDAARANARYLLELARHEGDLELRVNPAEYDALRDVAAPLAENTARLEHVEIVADALVERGGCVLRTRTGQIDAALETQLQRIAEALLPGVQGGR